MKILILATQLNGTGLANRLSRESKGITKVWLASDAKFTGAWENEKLALLPPPATVDQVLDFVGREAIDLVVVYNAIYGTGGVVDALEKQGVTCVGSNHRMAATEIHKQEFRRWLGANNFNSPRTLFEGSLADMASRAGEFTYPLVVKPQMQRGPGVAVCDDPQALRVYLERTHLNVPHARATLRFSIEEYVPIREHFHVGYLVSHGQGFIDFGVRIPSVREGFRTPGESTCVVFRHPANARYKAEINRFVDLVKEFTQATVASVQCGITPSGELYFIENNVRPGVHHGSLMSFADPLQGLLGIASGDPRLLTADRGDLDSEVFLGIGLLHAAEKIPVDLDRLRSIPECQYFANSVAQDGTGWVSHRDALPSVMCFRGVDPASVVAQVQRVLPDIQRCGTFLPLPMESVRRSVELAA